MEGVMPKERIPEGLARALFSYEADTGRLLWAVNAGRHGRIRAGTRAGSEHTDKDGYRSRYVTIDGRSYKASHVIWVWATGKWPKRTVDHKNLDGLDDRWDNLREADDSQQKQNNRRRKDSKTGYKCIAYYNDPRYRDGKCYRWQVVVNGKRIKSSVRYTTAKEAYEAYCARLSDFHGEFANDGATS